MRVSNDSMLVCVAVVLLSFITSPSWSQTPPLTLLSVNPANNATEVSRTVTPTLNFSANLNRASVSTNRVTLSAPSGLQSLSLSVTNNQLTLLPRSKLLPLTKYKLNVSGVRGVNGEALAAPVNTSFTTRDGAWQTARFITHPGSVITPPVLVENDAGAAFLTWLQPNQVGAVTPWAIRYLPGLGWSAPVALEPVQSTSSQPATIAVDHQGNALALWPRRDGSQWNLWSNHYTRGVGWGTAEVVANDIVVGTTSERQIAFDANDNAYVIFLQRNSSTAKAEVRAIRYSIATGWGVPEVIDANAGNATLDIPSVAFDAQGNAIAIWRCDPDNITDRICSNNYTAGVGWGTITIVATATYDSFFDYIEDSRLVVNPSGVAFVAWVQSTGIYARRYTSANGWEPQATAAPTTGYDLQLAASATGDAIIAYTRRIETPEPHNPSAGHFVVLGNHFSASSGWQSARLLQALEAYDAQTPKLVMDATGNGIVSWSGYNSSFYRAYTIRYRVDTGWAESRKVIDTTNTTYSYAPALAVDQSGDVLAVWQQAPSASDPLTGFWENRFQ